MSAHRRLDRGSRDMGVSRRPHIDPFENVEVVQDPTLPEDLHMFQAVNCHEDWPRHPVNASLLRCLQSGTATNLVLAILV